MSVFQLRPGLLLMGILGLTSAGCAASGAGDTEPTGSTRATLSSLQLSVLAGSVGEGGSVDGAASSARFGNLFGVAVSASGDVFVVESLAVRKIGAGASVTTFSALPTYGSDPPDNPDPRGLALDASGAVYVSNNNIYTVDKITGNGAITRVAGTLFSNGSPADLNHNEGVAVDASGNLYIADTWNDRVVKVAPGGSLTTLASGFSQPRGVAVDSAGNVLVADTGNHAIRSIAPGGTVITVAGSPSQTASMDGPVNTAGFASPSALTAGLDGTLYVVDGTTIRTISQGTVSTLVGSAGQSSLILGTLPASLENPSGVAITPHGDLIITETTRHVVLKVEGAGPDCSSGACSVYSEPSKVLADFPACSNGDLTSTLATACGVGGGEVPLSAGGFDSVTPPQLTVGTTYGVRLAASAGQNGGTVAFTAPSTDEYLVYLGTPNVPLSTDGEAPACSRYLSQSRVAEITGGTCDKFRGVYSLPLLQAGAQVRIRLGEFTPQSWVRVLVLPR
ncbi:MAG: hypothetical protein EOO73_14270 [Myxococcales bacterium]|nr:MAG: hypothetical protein EOO73_14270 [Myxococcales bacterium]